VPETTNRQQWNGTVDIKFKFIASSKIEIIQRQQNNSIETGPSSSAVIYASQTGSGPAQDEEEEEDDEAYVGKFFENKTKIFTFNLKNSNNRVYTNRVYNKK